MAERFRLVGGLVRTERGTRFLRRGDEIPDDLIEGERESLEALDAIGEPPVFTELKRTASIDIWTTQPGHFDQLVPLAQAVGVPVQLPPELFREINGGNLIQRRGDAVATQPAGLVTNAADLSTAAERGIWPSIVFLELDSQPAEAPVPWERVELVIVSSKARAEEYKPLCPGAMIVSLGRALPAPSAAQAAAGTLRERYPYEVPAELAPEPAS